MYYDIDRYKMDEITKTILTTVASDLVSYGILATYPKINALWKDKFVEYKILSVDDLIETPNRKIIIDTTEELLKIDDEYLQNCYLKLLKTAYHKDKQNIAHPAFSFLVSQLSRDEAIMLYHLSTKDKLLKQKTYFKMDQLTNTHNIPTDYIDIIQNELLTDELFYQNNWALYQSHLMKLDLVSNHEVYNETLHRPLSPKVGMLIQHTDNKGNPVEPYGFEAHYQYHLTDFGKMFAQACIPNDIDIEQFDYLRKYQPKKP